MSQQLFCFVSVILLWSVTPIVAQDQPQITNDTFVVASDSTTIKIEDSIPSYPYRRIRPIAWLSGGINIHKASFQTIPGLVNCCSNFSGGVGITPVFGAGIEYVPLRKKWDMAYRLGARLLFAPLSASHITEQDIANFIGIDDVTKVRSKFTLSTSIPTISVEPYITIQPKESIPIEVVVGGGMSFPLSASYTFKEELLSPSDALFENRTKTRGESQGAIQGIATPFWSAFGALRHTGFTLSSIQLRPEVSYHRYFPSVISGYSWNVQSIRLGVSAEFMLRYPQIEPVVVEPVPEPPAKKIYALRPGFTVTVNGKPYKNGDTTYFPIFRQFRPMTTIIPKVLFYEKDSINLTPENNERLKELRAYIVKMINDSGRSSKFVVTGYSASDEAQSVAKRRADNVVEYLISYGISPIAFTVATAKRPTPKRSELLDEDRKVTISSDNPLISFIGYNSTFTDRAKAAPPTVIVEPKITNDTTIVYQKLIVFEDARLAPGTLITPAGVLYDTSVFTNGRNKWLSFPLRVRDTLGTQVDSTFNVFIFRSFVNDTLALNSTETESSTQEFYLGLCDYDKPTFSTINTVAIEYIKYAVRSGMKLELIGSTDDLGTEDHNTNLAKMRVNEALRLLGLKPENVSISLQNQAVQQTTTAVSRLKNRCVIARLTPASKKNN